MQIDELHQTLHVGGAGGFFDLAAVHENTEAGSRPKPRRDIRRARYFVATPPSAGG